MKRIFQTSLRVALLGFALALLGTGTQSATAATGGLTISPTSVDAKIDPGTTYKSNIQVINQGDDAFTYKLYATPYNVDGEAYKPYFTPVRGATDITDWITLSSQGGQLKGGSESTTPVSIKVPKGTGAGSYYATVFAETEDKGDSGVITRKRVGTILYIRVTGQATEKASVESWSVPWLQQDPFTAKLRLSNNGSVHYQSKVKVTVSDLFGRPKYVWEREPKVLPQKIRLLPVEWKDGARFGLFKVSGEVTYFGKTETLPTKYVFVASPLLRIVSLLVIVGFVTFVIIVGRKRAVSKKQS